MVVWEAEEEPHDGTVSIELCGNGGEQTAFSTAFSRATLSFLCAKFTLSIHTTDSLNSSST